MTTSDFLRIARRALVLTIAWTIAIAVVLIERAVLPFASALIAYLKRPETKAAAIAMAKAALAAGRAATLWIRANLDLVEVGAVIATGIQILITAVRSAGAATGRFVHHANDRLAAIASKPFRPAFNNVAWFSSESFSSPLDGELSADQIALLEEMHDYELELTMAEAVPF